MREYSVTLMPLEVSHEPWDSLYINTVQSNFTGPLLLNYHALTTARKADGIR